MSYIRIIALFIALASLFGSVDAMMGRQWGAMGRTASITRLFATPVNPSPLSSIFAQKLGKSQNLVPLDKDTTTATQQPKQKPEQAATTSHLSDALPHEFKLDFSQFKAVPSPAPQPKKPTSNALVPVKKQLQPASFTPTLDDDTGLVRIQPSKELIRAEKEDFNNFLLMLIENDHTSETGLSLTEPAKVHVDISSLEPIEQRVVADFGKKATTIFEKLRALAKIKKSASTQPLLLTHTTEAAEKNDNTTLITIDKQTSHDAAIMSTLQEAITEMKIATANHATLSKEALAILHGMQQYFVGEIKKLNIVNQAMFDSLNTQGVPTQANKQLVLTHQTSVAPSTPAITAITNVSNPTPLMPHVAVAPRAATPPIPQITSATIPSTPTTNPTQLTSTPTGAPTSPKFIGPMPRASSTQSQTTPTPTRAPITSEIHNNPTPAAQAALVAAAAVPIAAHTTSSTLVADAFTTAAPSAANQAKPQLNSTVRAPFGPQSAPIPRTTLAAKELAHKKMQDAALKQMIQKALFHAQTALPNQPTIATHSASGIPHNAQPIANTHTSAQLVTNPTKTPQLTVQATPPANPTQATPPTVPPRAQTLEQARRIPNNWRTTQWRRFLEQLRRSFEHLRGLHLGIPRGLSLRNLLIAPGPQFARPALPQPVHNPILDIQPALAPAPAAPRRMTLPPRPDTPTPVTPTQTRAATPPVVPRNTTPALAPTTENAGLSITLPTPPWQQLANACKNLRDAINKDHLWAHKELWAKGNTTPRESLVEPIKHEMIRLIQALTREIPTPNNMRDADAIKAFKDSMTQRLHDISALLDLYINAYNACNTSDKKALAAYDTIMADLHDKLEILNNRLRP